MRLHLHVRLSLLIGLAMLCILLLLLLQALLLLLLLLLQVMLLLCLLLCLLLLLKFVLELLQPGSNPLVIVALQRAPVNLYKGLNLKRSSTRIHLVLHKKIED